MRTVLALLLVGASLGGGRAAAHDHAPPEPVLRAGRSEQPGVLIASCWIRGKELAGAAVCRQTETTFPEAVQTARRTAAIDLGRAEPKRVRLRAWRRLRPSGEPRRPTRRPVVALEEAEGGWVATFALPERPRTWYLEAKAVWPDRASPDSEQFGVWTFALRTA